MNLLPRRIPGMAAALLGIVFLAGCKPTTPWAGSNQPFSNSSAKPAQTAQSSIATHNLSLDESQGGHTLKRHVGRTDEQLEERLRDEPNISAASTYTDRATAETVIADALQRNQQKITRWLERNKHPNLVLDYDGERPVGRTLNRDARQSSPCSNAIIVLRWQAPNEYYILTSYPECR
jgi:hypothetical protein